MYADRMGGMIMVVLKGINISVELLLDIFTGKDIIIDGNTIKAQNPLPEDTKIIDIDYSRDVNGNINIISLIPENIEDVPEDIIINFEKTYGE